VTTRLQGTLRRIAAVGGTAVLAALLPMDANGQEDPSAISLREAVNLALANSRTLADAEHGLEGARQQVREAWSNVMPDISLNATYSRNLLLQQIFLPCEFFDPNCTPGDTRPVQVGSDNTWTAALSVSQPLFEYGVFVGVGAAGRYEALQEEIVRGTSQQVVTAVRQAYFTALLALEELRLTEESIARVRRNLVETRARYEAGLVSEYDVLRFEVELATVSANLERAENQVAAAKRVLLVEMGLEPDADIELTGRLDEVNPDSLEANSLENQELILLAGIPGVLQHQVEDLIGTALLRRTDIRQLEATVSLEEARVKSVKGQFYPTLSLFTNYNVQAQQNGGPNFFGSTNNRTTSAAAGLQVSMPIFQGFGRFAQVHQAEAVVRQNETRLERMEQETANQVRTLFDGAQESLSRARSQRRAVSQAQRGYEIASAEYGEGIGSQLQVTDAEVALRQAEYNYALAIYDHLLARARLELATGMVPDAAGEFPASWDQVEINGEDNVR
jgi:outer membrane protein TolC